MCGARAPRREGGGAYKSKHDPARLGARDKALLTLVGDGMKR